ncbi:MAG: T9SS type A sorting domain-containing protein [Ignavibacteria bacterium]|nr:T9SS type A sorting domain-containing protein [Ignavibacteria bacterium]
MNEEKAAGSYTTEFNAANHSSGIYFYQIRAGEFIQTKKMVLLR